MVTTSTQSQELLEQEEELARQREQLNQYQNQARTISEEQIPQRKFGSGVTQEVQQRYIERREQAQQYLESTEVTKQSIEQRQREIDERQAEIQRYEQRQANIDTAERLAEKYSRTGDARVLWSASLKIGKDKEAWRYFNELRKYYASRQGKKPVYDDKGVSKQPTITKIGEGYEDPFATQYGGQSRLPTPIEKLTGQPSKPIYLGNNKYITQEVKYDYPVSEKIEEPQFTPREDLGYKIKGYTQGGKEVRELPLFKKQEAPELKLFVKGLVRGGEVAVLGTYNTLASISQAKTYTVINKPLESTRILPQFKKGEITKEDIQIAIKEPEYGYGFVAAQYFSLKLPKVYLKLFNEPIKAGTATRIREVLQIEDQVFIVERTKQYNIAKQVIQPVNIDGKALSLAKFELSTVTPERVQKVYPSRFSKLFFSPSDKVIQPTRVDITKSSPIFIDESGEIVNRAATFTSRKGSKLTFVSEIYGKQEPVTIENFNKLPLTSQKNLQELAERRVGIPVSLERTPYLLPKEDLISFGEIVSVKRLRVSPSSRTALIYSKGKRTSVGAVTSISKEILKTDEYTLLKGETTVADISLPKISGKTKRIIIEDETLVLQPKSLGNDVEFITGSLTQQRKITPKQIETLNKFVGVTAKAVQKPIKYSTPKVTIEEISPEIKPVQIPRVQSEYYGKGTYERTDGGALPIVSERTITIQRNIQPVKYVENTILKPSVRSLQLESLSSVQKDLTVQLNIPAQANLLKETQVTKQAQQQRQQQSQVLKQSQIQKLGTSTLPRITPVRTSTPKNYRLPKFDLDFRKESGSKAIAGYRSFVIVKGIKKYLSGVTERGTALRKGEDIAKETLRATFGIERAGQIRGKETRYNPSNIFRNYRIRKGQRVQLQDTYIQRRGKRLISTGEVSELLSYRRNR